MSEEMIHSIIDDIAHDAKIIISEHLHPECDDLVDALKQSAKDWEEVGEKTRKVFRDLEDDIREYAEKNCVSITSGDDYAEDDACTEFGIGDEIVFIGNGCAVKDRISRVLVETEHGYQVYVDDAFRSLDELVEHLKQHVHG